MTAAELITTIRGYLALNEAERAVVDAARECLCELDDGQCCELVNAVDALERLKEET